MKNCSVSVYHNSLYERCPRVTNDSLKGVTAEWSCCKSSAFANSSKDALDKKISDIFNKIGIHANIKGFQYLREAVKIAVNDFDIITRITKCLYPMVAERFGTNVCKVEKNIRHAIAVAGDEGRLININGIFGSEILGKNDRPTNGQLIALIADHIILENF